MKNTQFCRRFFSGTISYLCFCILIAAVSSPAAAAAPIRKPASTNRFLIASDLHFNPMADASLVPQLDKASPTEWETILDRSKPTAFSQYGQDTNWWLLRSALDAMRVTLPHPSFIMLTGDFLAHQFPQTYQRTAQDNSRVAYRNFVLKTVEFLSLELRKRFPQTRIYLTPGNNDNECGNYSIEADGLFLRDTADVARQLARADDEFTNTWQALGSYDVPNPALHGVRIISLNTVFLSNKYHAAQFASDCAPVPSTAPADLFTWLEGRLNLARQAHEKVWLMFHIPPGMDGFTSIQQYLSVVKQKSDKTPPQVCASALVPMWVPKWTKQFDDLLAKYENTVVASFAGHTHADDFRVIDNSAGNSSFVLISPAISPIYNQNPSFRTVTFAANGSVSDQSVYYLTNLLFASSSSPGEWKREYTFSQEWKMEGVNAKNLAALYREILGEQADQDEWLKLYNVSSSAAYVPAGMAPGLYCAIEGLDPEAYGKCFCPAVTHSN